MKKFLIGRAKGAWYVLKGMWFLVSKEDAIKAQLFIFLIVTGLGCWVGITPQEWLIQVFCFGLIWVAEGLNTAIENICDYIQPKHYKRIGLIKDISAGAVGMAALFAFINACIIYCKYLM